MQSMKLIVSKPQGELIGQSWTDQYELVHADNDCGQQVLIKPDRVVGEINHIQCACGHHFQTLERKEVSRLTNALEKAGKHGKREMVVLPNESGRREPITVHLIPETEREEVAYG